MNHNPILDQEWYYTIEIEPHVFITGKEHANIAITRKLLRNVNVSGMDCIDIGTQEGLIPILLEHSPYGYRAEELRLSFSSRT